MAADADRALEEGDKDTAALQYYKAQLGSPKNKRLMKAMNEQDRKSVV